MSLLPTGPLRLGGLPPKGATGRKNGSFAQLHVKQMIERLSKNRSVFGSDIVLAPSATRRAEIVKKLSKLRRSLVTIRVEFHWSASGKV